MTRIKLNQKKAQTGFFDGVVWITGLEPARVASLEPESSVFTSFTISTYIIFYNIFGEKSNSFPYLRGFLQILTKSHSFCVEMNMF